EKHTGFHHIARGTSFDALFLDLGVIMEMDNLRRALGVFEHLCPLCSGGYYREVRGSAARAVGTAIGAEASMLPARRSGSAVQLNCADRYHFRAHTSHAQLI